MNNNKLKDTVINYLVEQLNRKGNRFSFNSNELRQNIGCSVEELNMIIEQFSKKGLINAIPTMHGNYIIIINQELLDLKDNGGFARQYEILNLQYEQLCLEIDKLKNDFPEKIAEETSTLNNIIDIGKSLLSAASFFIRHTQ